MSEISDEVQRLNDGLWRMTYRGGTYIAEVPMRIHSRDLDAGGAPEFHPAFLSFLRDGGACLCPETKPDGTPQPHFCDRQFEGQARFRDPKRESHPRRLKRAFRQLRLLAPYDQYHLVFLVVGRKWSFPQALERVNAARLARGEAAMAQEDAALVLVTGVDLLQASW